VKHDQLILVHTPHLEDKLKGTRLIVDLKNFAPKDQARPRHHRPRRGAHRPLRPRSRLLGRHHALSREQMLAARAIDMLETAGPSASG
jgi:hypothetical protein